MVPGVHEVQGQAGVLALMLGIGGAGTLDSCEANLLCATRSQSV